MSIRFNKDVARARIAAFKDLQWAELHRDPRTCPSERATLCMYERWMGRTEKRPGGKHSYHMHMALAMPQHMYQNTARFRLGCWPLLMNTARKRSTGRLPRHERCCPECMNRGIHAVEDEMHVVFECPTYADLRLQFNNLYNHPASEDMYAFMQTKHTWDLGTLLTEMLKRHKALGLH